MADWTSISDAQVDPDAPLTSGLGYAWRDNPIAIAEGASGAPRVRGRALSHVSFGAIAVTGTGGQGYTDCAGVGVVMSPMHVATNGRVLRARYSNNNGSTWGSWQTVISITGPGGGAGNVAAGHCRLNLQTGVFAAHYITQGSTFFNAANSGTHTVPVNCNAFQLSWDSAAGDPVGYFDFYNLGGIV